MTEHLLSGRGYFWWAEEIIPDRQFAPNSAVPGALEISKTGRISLRLDGTLPRNEMTHPFVAIFDKKIATRKISGIIAGTNKYVRLTDLRQNGGTANTQGPSSEGMIAAQCLVSRKPFSPTDEPRFRAVQLSLEGYEDWLGLRSIEIIKALRTVQARYSRPMEYSWKLRFGSLELIHDISHPFPGRLSSVTLSESASLILSLDEPVDIHTAMEHAFRIEDILLLITDFDNGTNYPLVDLGDGEFMQLFYPRLERPEGQFLASNCWMRFPLISTKFGNIVESWIIKQAEFGPAFHLYLGNRRLQKMYPEHRFASLVWGLESLHRRTHSPTQNAALNAKIERIMGQITCPRDKKWLSTQLKNAEQPGLEGRLADVFGRLPLKFDTAKLMAFTKRCADRRNELSHHGGMRDKGSYDQFLHEVLELLEPLDILYHATLLNEIGAPAEEIRWYFMEGFNQYRVKNILSSIGLTIA